ncbi:MULTISPECIES: MmgE/PrpD family protein [unclassified Adlercreutzia]|uniref:MmgE/PrpD family protein n=1 Tax=unclassified Adlercreutzia TaxID=2636013 RepID=UPI0013EC0240|nr:MULTISPECIES: MmgE/PrpD family protein [unclassified Adlercreutzia]
MNTTEAFVNHFINTNYDALDEETIRRAKLRLLDSFGVAVAGARSIGVDAIRNVLVRIGGAKEATVLGFGDKLPAAHAAMLNALMMRSFDFDTVMNVALDGEVFPSHLGACSVPALVAAGEFHNKSGKEILAAQVLGDDFGARLTVCSGYAPTGLFDNTGTSSGMAAAAAVSKLYDLDAAQFLNALGLMVNMISGSTMNVMQACMTFKFPMANAARNAVFAADFARNGYTAMKDPITDPKGYFAMFGGDHHTEHLLTKLGEVYLGDAVIKPWPGCRETHMGVHAVLEATGGIPIDPDEVESFVVYLDEETPSFLNADFTFGDTNQVQGAFSGRFTAASAALNGYLRPESYLPDAMTAPKLSKMLDIMRIETDGSLGSLWHSRARIELKDGTIYESDVDYTLGDFDRSPLDDERVLEKFYRNVAYAGLVDCKQAERAAELLLNVEELDSLDEIFDNLTA